MKRTLALAFLLHSALAVAAAPEKKPLTIDDVWAVPRVGAPVLSPDGKAAAFAVTVWDAEEDKSNADIWLVDVASGASRRLTANKASDTSPAFSPDGKRIAFVSKRDGDTATQLYVLPVDGGEAERLTELPTAVVEPEVVPGRQADRVSRAGGRGADGTPEETKKALEKREKAKVKARTTENRLFRFWDHWLTDGECPHLFTVDVATKKVTDLTPGNEALLRPRRGRPNCYDISPDGSSRRLRREQHARAVPDAQLGPVPRSRGRRRGPRNLTPGRAGEDDEPRLLAGREDDRLRHGAQGRRLARLHAPRAPRRRDRERSRS